MCRCKCSDNKIHIPAKKARANEQGVIKLTPSAMEALMEVVNEQSIALNTVVVGQLF